MNSKCVPLTRRPDASSNLWPGSHTPLSSEQKTDYSPLVRNSESLSHGAGIVIQRAELTDPVSRRLIDALNEELSGAYPEPGATHFGLDPAEVSGRRGAFLVVYEGGNPVGCGAVRLIDAATGELKRMYIAASKRGRGLGHLLVHALEQEAWNLGARKLILETGIRQAAAIALYRGTGFLPIPLYGEYLLSPKTSLCFGKELGSLRPSRRAAD
jgi:GNAT superfamily N-acetyltransferase